VTKVVRVIISGATSHHHVQLWVESGSSITSLTGVPIKV
jgi:hypothetical protein